MASDLAPEFRFLPQEIVRERMGIEPDFFHPHFDALGRTLRIHHGERDILASVRKNDGKTKRQNGHR